MDRRNIPSQSISDQIFTVSRWVHFIQNLRETSGVNLPYRPSALETDQ